MWWIVAAVLAMIVLARRVGAASDIPIRGDVGIPIYPKNVMALAAAIATAEGYGRPGVIPTVRNNPGDLVDASGAIQTFATIAEGWRALYAQCSLMLYGGSQHYRPTQTIREVAQIYTATERDAWAVNVASYLGLTPDSRLFEIEA